MESAVFLAVLAAGFIVFLVVLAMERLETQSERQKLYAAYQAALTLLAVDPKNEALQRRVLRLGELYDNLPEQGKGLTARGPAPTTGSDQASHKQEDTLLATSD